MKEEEEVDQPQGSPPRYEEAHGYEAQTEGGVLPEDQEDKRVAISLRFIEDDEFIKTHEFKDFWIKIKMKEFEEKKQINMMSTLR